MSTAPLSVRVVLLPVNGKSRNGRFYPRRVVKKMLRPTDPFMRAVKEGRLLGEAATPQPAPELSRDDFIKRVGQVSLDQVCLKVAKVEIRGQELLGTIVPFGPKSEELARLIRDGKQVEVAFRGFTQRLAADPEEITNIISVAGFDLIPPAN